MKQKKNSKITSFLLLVLVVQEYENTSLLLTRAWAEDIAFCVSVTIRKYCVLLIKLYSNRKSIYHSVNNMCE